MTDIVRRVCLALSFIDPTDRETWLKTGMALKSGLGEAGFSIWDRWAQQSTKYDTACSAATWRSIQRHGGITIRTLFFLAKQGGWRDE